MLNLADITGTGAAVPLSTPNLTARWLICVVSGAGTARFGGSPNTPTSTLGLPVAAGQSITFPPMFGDTIYSLGQIEVYIPVGATVSIGYEPYGGSV